MTTQDLRFRPATEADLDRILEIHVAAYTDDRPAPVRRRNFTANALGELSDLVVALRGDDIVAQAFLFPVEAWFGGRAVRMGAVASVASAPEVRGQGVATALLEHLHAAADARGDALTMLYAFRHRFYARLGYGTSSSRKRLAIDARAIPATWRALARDRVRRARGEDRAAMVAAYGRAAAKTSGWLTRSEAFWERHLACERRQLIVADGGYVAFQMSQEGLHAATTLAIDELVADDDVTRRALLGALGAMRDQVVEIELEVDANDPLELALVDSDGRRFGTDEVEHDLGTIVGGPMVRIEDVPRALEARGYSAEIVGTLDVVVHADEAERLRGGEELAVSVHVEGGRAEVSAARGAAAALRTTRAALASVLYGGLRASDALRLGLVDADPRTIARAEAMFALAPMAPVDPF
jgi:predicted acetyltransferase